jgi:probable rRNA maturation factor
MIEIDTDTNIAEGELDELPRRCVGIVVADDRWAEIDGLEDLLTRAVEATIYAVECAPNPPVSLDIALSNDAEVRVLNAKYRGKDKPTNVLSFPAMDIPAGSAAAGPRFIGDVILAYETTAAEAAAEGKTLSAHAAHLAVHGTLHLLGHDHEAEDEAAEMEALETAILGKLGFPDPYGDAIAGEQ